MNLQLRLLGPADLELLQYVGRASYEPYYPHVWYEGGLEWYMERCFGAPTLRSELADPGVRYYLATDAGGQLAGFLKLLPHKPVPGTDINKALYLEKIYLMPAFFKTGAGQRLIEWTLEQARTSGFEAVWLQVMRTGPVRAYEKAGFEITGATRFEFDLLRAEERDGWVMLKML
jgi:GNAT superfamily N-acetyltransferase